MLALTRKESERIVIGRIGDVLTEPIIVTLVRVGPHRAKLGIDAPRNMNIRREEVPDDEREAA